MKTLLSFLRNTLTGGILFLLPVVIILLLLKKAHEIIYVWVEPLARRMPDIFFGFDGSRTIALIIMIAVCFISGLFVRSNYIKRRIGLMEDRFLTHIPGYSLMKSIAAGALGKEDQAGLIPVVSSEDGISKIGFMVEELEDRCVIFFPEPLDSNSGEVLIMPTTSIRRLNLPANKVTLGMKQFGKGLLQHINTLES